MSIADVVAAVRERAPLVHCLTAAVSMTTVADGLLAAGARPMMTETEAEAPAVVRRADALLVNLGTLSTDGMAGIPATVAAARDAGIGWVLDPAAIGAAPVRTPLAGRLVALGPRVVRCNASEALVLAGLGHGGRGADSTANPDDALRAARLIAREHGTVVAVSGAVDVLTDGDRVARLASGDVMLTRVTGTGCTLGALTAACVAVADPWDAARAASAWLAVAGERAALQSSGPGSFRSAWLDALFSLSPGDVEGEARWA